MLDASAETETKKSLFFFPVNSNNICYHALHNFNYSVMVHKKNAYTSIALHIKITIIFGSQITNDNKQIQKHKFDIALFKK